MANFEAVMMDSSKYHFTADTIVGTQDKYTWDFNVGGEHYPKDTIIDYSYQDVDTVYNICLIVEKIPDVCKDTICKTIMIGNPSPIGSHENTLDTCIVLLVVDSFYIYDVVEDTTKTNYYYVLWTIVQNNGDVIQIPSEYYLPDVGVHYVELTINCGKDQSTSVGGKVLIRDNPGIINNINNDSNKKANAYLYPNPANDKLNISVKTEICTEADIQVLNSLGQIVFSNNYAFSKGVNIITLNISTLRQGLYLIRIDTADNTIIEKFIK